MDKDIRRAFEEMGRAFDVNQSAFNEVFEQRKKVKQEDIHINFSSRRWATFSKFIGCALEILFTGKTTLVIKKR